MSDLPFFLSDLEARPAPAPAPLRAQVDAWEDGATLTLLVAVQAEARARAWVVRHDAATESWTGGCANLSPCLGHHDRHAAATRIPKRHMTGADMALLWAAPGENGLGAVAEEFLREAGRPKGRAPGVAED